jgi:acetyl-CoA acetyltransferase
MYSLRDKYAIAGIGYTDFSKKSGRTVRSLASEACLKAIDDSGLKVADIDGFVSFNFNDSVPAISVATEIGVPAARYANDFLSGGNAANMIVLTAAAVIEAGLAETASGSAAGAISPPMASPNSPLRLAGSLIRRRWPCGVGVT